MTFLLMTHPVVESHVELERLWGLPSKPCSCQGQFYSLGAPPGLLFVVLAFPAHRLAHGLAAPVVCAVTGIAGGHVIIALKFVSVFFAHWAPAKLAARILRQPSGVPLNVSHWAASVPGVFGGKGHGVEKGCVWNSRNWGSWIPLGLLSPVCELWVGSRDRACVKGVERAWVGVLPSRHKLCKCWRSFGSYAFYGYVSLGYLVLQEVLYVFDCQGVAVDPGVSVNGSAKGMSPSRGLFVGRVGEHALGRTFDQFQHAGVCSTLIISAYIVLFMRRDSGGTLGELSWLCLMVLMRSGVRLWGLRV
eukprot:1157184-Pelagomonas_calceolata.AAC.2